jgi:hypothetical protein
MPAFSACREQLERRGFVLRRIWPKPFRIFVREDPTRAQIGIEVDESGYVNDDDWDRILEMLDEMEE